MKKVISLFLMLLLCATMVFLATSCDTEYTIEDFKSKIDAAGNYQISAVNLLPHFGYVTDTIKIDGNILSTQYFSNTVEYWEIVGNVTYQYSQRDDGTWSKETSDTQILEDFYLLDIEKWMDPSAYEKVEDQKNTYQMKSDALVEYKFGVVEELPRVANAFMRVEKDSCSIDAIDEERFLIFSWQISKIGEIELTLPAVE